MNGLGLLIPTDLSTQVATAQAATTVKPKDGSTFNNIANGIASLFNSAAPIVQSVTQPKPGTPGYNPAVLQNDALNAGGGSAPKAEAKSNTMKYVLIGLGVLVGGGILYKVATKKKKAFAGVGCADDEAPTDTTDLSGTKKRARKRKK